MTPFTRSYCTCRFVSLLNTRRSWFGCHIFVFAWSVESHRSVANHWKATFQWLALNSHYSAWDWTNRLNLKDFNSVVAAGWICYGMATQVCVYLHTVNVNDDCLLCWCGWSVGSDATTCYEQLKNSVSAFMILCPSGSLPPSTPCTCTSVISVLIVYSNKQKILQCCVLKSCPFLIAFCSEFSHWFTLALLYYRSILI